MKPYTAYRNVIENKQILLLSSFKSSSVAFVAIRPDIPHAVTVANALSIAEAGGIEVEP